eukprot:364365-Chlamydomonas_euryale.AAC.3
MVYLMVHVAIYVMVHSLGHVTDHVMDPNVLSFRGIAGGATHPDTAKLRHEACVTECGRHTWTVCAATPRDCSSAHAAPVPSPPLSPASGSAGVNGTWNSATGKAPAGLLPASPRTPAPPPPPPAVHPSLLAPL